MIVAKNKKIEYYLDKRFDTLNVFIHKSKEYDVEDITSDITIFKYPDTNVIISVEIMYYSKKDKQKLNELIGNKIKFDFRKVK